MSSKSPWYESVSIPALLRRARTVYSKAMRGALDEAGYDDIPKSGLFIIGGLAHEKREVPLSRLIDDLSLSKQSAGQLVDTLVARGYLEREVDPADRRRLIVRLTERGRAAAEVQTAARERVESVLSQRVGEAGILTLRKGLAALTGLPKDVTPGLRLTGIVPILFVRDVPRAARFYRDKLGFEIDFLHGDPPFYGSVSRDNACLHLRFVGEPNFTELAAREEALILATIEVSDIRALHDEFAGRDLECTREIEEQVWGGTDFHVRDPDGNEISFVEYRKPDLQEGKPS